MTTLALVGLGVGIWVITLFTYILGYSAGKTAGYALGRSNARYEDDDDGTGTIGGR